MIRGRRFCFGEIETNLQHSRHILTAAEHSSYMKKRAIQLGSTQSTETFEQPMS
jgi:hypothetical protein